MIRISDLVAGDEGTIHQLASLLVEVFRENAPEAWPTMDAALEEVRESLAEDHVRRVATDADGAVVGWIGGVRRYQGHAWELHPLVVRPDRQRRGIGRALVADLEARVRERGGVTIYLGTDDEDGRTTLANRDLYPDVLAHLGRIENPGGHPYEFYQKQGYTIVGVIPDANGPGKPDILMAKRVAA